MLSGLYTIYNIILHQS